MLGASPLGVPVMSPDEVNSVRPAARFGRGANFEKPNGPRVPEIIPCNVVSTLPTGNSTPTVVCAPKKRCSNV